MEGGSLANILRLPEESVSHAISLTSPRDACRLEAVSAAFRSAAVSDTVWKRFLPSDYAEFLARAVDCVEFSSMKHLYFRLCDPILIDSGKMGFFVDREIGAKCFILPARELEIAQGDSPRHWEWIYHPESRFSEVAELIYVLSRLEIRGRINSRMLSKWSNYSAYLIFKVLNTAWRFRYILLEASVAVGAHVSKSTVCLINQKASRFRFNFRWDQFVPEDLEEPLNDQPVELQEDLPEAADEPRHDRQSNLHEQAQDQSPWDGEMVRRTQTRKDGWMEILLGEFYNEEGDDGEVVMSLLEIEGRGIDKCGLIVQGIEIRPKK